MSRDSFISRLGEEKFHEQMNAKYRKDPKSFISFMNAHRFVGRLGKEKSHKHMDAFKANMELDHKSFIRLTPNKERWGSVSTTSTAVQKR
jgi:sulfite reductase beta subunit-like hemoprotein